jgi:hypothetical protein
MKKYNTTITITAIATTMLILLTSCGNNTNDAQAVIEKYCELNTKEHNAPAGAEKEAAAAKKKAYEKEVDDKYFKNYKTYQLILNGMKKCDEAQAAVPASGSDTNDELLAMISLANSDAATAANAYCNLVDKSAAAAQNGTEAELKKIVAIKVIFEKALDESYKVNPQRRDSVYTLIEPCLNKEVKFRHQ